MILFQSPFPCFRLTDQPLAHHGQTGSRPLRVVQSSHRQGRPRRGHQQEALAGGHQGPRTPILHHVGRIHAKNPVS